jgi:hypothetical protein
MIGLSARPTGVGPANFVQPVFSRSVHVRTKRNEDKMSSKTPRYVTTCQLELIRQVLSDSGYSAKVWSTSPPNLAAKTLIALLQHGIADPIDLARELETRFG